MRRLFAAALLPLIAGLGLAAGRAADGDQKWGTIKGQIIWAGEALPEFKKVDVNKNQDHCLSKGDIYSEEWIINKKNKGIRWVFVWLIPEGNGKLAIHPDLEKIKVKELMMDQPCCKFEPHAIALRKGQTLVVKNSSPISHNVDWKGLLPTQGNNVSVPAGNSMKISPKPSKYPIQISCGIHPWMHAWLRVFDHLYYTLTDAVGNFEIKNAPAGKCRLMIWQDNGYRNGEKGAKGEPIEIKTGGVTDLGKIEWKPKKD